MFLVVSTTVFAASWISNQPVGKETIALPIQIRLPTPFHGVPSGSPGVAATALGENFGGGYLDPEHFGEVKGTDWYLDAPYGSP